MISLSPVNLTPVPNPSKAVSWSTMANACVGIVTEFLGPKEAVGKLTHLNKSTRDIIYFSNDCPPFKKVSLVADKAIEFLSSVPLPLMTRVEWLDVTGPTIVSIGVTGAIFKKLQEIAESTNEQRINDRKIKKLSFGSSIPLSYIMKIIEAAPNLDSLAFYFLRLQGNRALFDPKEGKSLSSTAAANLASLTNLTIRWGKMH